MDTSTGVRRRATNDAAMAATSTTGQTSAAADAAQQLPSGAGAIAGIQLQLGNAVVRAALAGGDAWHADVAGALAGGLVGLNQAPEAQSNHQVVARIHRHGGGTDVAAVLGTLSQSSGFALQGEQLERFETAFAHDLAHVRIHTDGVAAEAAKALNAYAFALGSDLYFAPGTYAPGTQKGDRLLAHELTHVIQHDENRLPVPSSGDDQVSSPSDPTEREAYANENVILGRLARSDSRAATEQVIDPIATLHDEAIPDAVEQRWSSQLGEAAAPQALDGAQSLLDMASALGADAFLPEQSGSEAATVVQQRASDTASLTPAEIKQQARRGAAGAGGTLPYLEQIQAAFGDFDITGVRAHTGAAAADASRAMGAHAYASGDDVVFGQAPDLHTAAYEAAHIIQQRAGVSLGDGVGEVGDRYERHADAVADQVVSGRSAEGLLSQMADAAASGASPGEGAQLSAGAVQFVKVSEANLQMGEKFKEKHLGNFSRPANLSTREGQEDALESVFYHRPSDDQRPVNAVFFVSAAEIASDLNTKYGPEELDYGKVYETEKTYFAMSCLRVQKDDKYKRAVLSYGEAKAQVKVNKEGGQPVYNHLQGTNPDTLETQVDLGGDSGAVQKKSKGRSDAKETNQVHAAARDGVSGGGSTLPHLARIQAAFGDHDVSGVKAHTGGPAARAADAIGARAYATGEDIAFGSSPDLHTAAHEAAHVVQQRQGVSLGDGLGQAGDRYEQHADAVADAVVAGQSAEALLGATITSGEQAASTGAVQRVESDNALHDTERGVKLKLKRKNDEKSTTKAKDPVVALNSSEVGSGSATVATSAGADYLAKDSGSYTTVFLQLKKDHPDKSDDELLDIMASQEVNKGSRTGHMGENTAAEDGKKEALVIGNETYANASNLPGAKSDAAAIASTYAGQGFTVDHQADLSGGAIQKEVNSAGKGLTEGDALLVYYAGHGTRDGVVGVDYPADGAVVSNSVMSGKAGAAKSAGYHATVLIDACHSGALVDQMEKDGKKDGAGSDGAVQKKDSGAAASESAQQVHAQATAGVADGGSALPHLARIQEAFGDHDVSGVKAHTGGPAARAADAIGARAYATGEDIAFGSSPDLHTAAHEAAHVVQQRQGVSLGDGLGQAGDRYEQHADAVADAVVAGQSVEALLGPTETAVVAPSTDLQARFDGAGEWMNGLDVQTLTNLFTDQTTAALWRELSAHQVDIRVTTGGPSYNFQTCELSIPADMLAAIRTYTESGEKPASLGMGLAALTHEMSHAHDHIVRKERPKSAERGTDAYTCAVLKTELRAWMREASASKELRSGKQIPVAADTNDLTNSWLSIHFAHSDGTDVLTMDMYKNQVIGRLNRYYATNRAEGSATTLNEMMLSPDWGLKEDLIAYAAQVRGAYNASDEVLRGALAKSAAAEATQKRSAGHTEETARGNTQQVAAAGVSGSGSALPHREAIQQAFGSHDISGVRAHQGPDAESASAALGAHAYARGESIAFGSNPDLHTAAHEAAHVVQQRAGVSLPGGLGSASDAYEIHADQVADAVVAGQNAEALLGDATQRSDRAADTGAVQLKKGARKDAVDDRHDITDPAVDPERWANTMKKTRVAQLFLTAGGLPGHVEAIQVEVNRLIGKRGMANKVEGHSGAEVSTFTDAFNDVRAALIASAKASTFDFDKFHIQFAPLAPDLYLGKKGGKLHVG